MCIMQAYFNLFNWRCDTNSIFVKTCMEIAIPWHRSHDIASSGHIVTVVQAHNLLSFEERPLKETTILHVNFPNFSTSHTWLVSFWCSDTLPPSFFSKQAIPMNPLSVQNFEHKGKPSFYLKHSGFNSVHQKLDRSWWHYNLKLERAIIMMS